MLISKRSPAGLAPPEIPAFFFGTDMSEMFAVATFRAWDGVVTNEFIQLFHELGMKVADAVHIGQLTAGHVIQTLFHVLGKIQVQEAECPDQGVPQVFHRAAWVRGNFFPPGHRIVQRWFP